MIINRVVRLYLANGIGTVVSGITVVVLTESSFWLGRYSSIDDCSSTHGPHCWSFPSKVFLTVIECDGKAAVFLGKILTDENV